MLFLVDEEKKLSYNFDCILGIDYGSHKIGLAIVDNHGSIVELTTVNLEMFTNTIKKLIERYKPIVIVAGKTKPAMNYLASVLDEEIKWVDEQNTTVEAKQLFFRNNPKQNLIKFVWNVILYLLGAYHLDGWAAAVIARRYLIASSPEHLN